MPTSGDGHDEVPGEHPRDNASLAERVASLELQIGELKHQLDNLTTEFAPLRSKLEPTRTAFDPAPKALLQRAPEAEMPPVVIEVLAAAPPPPSRSFVAAPPVPPAKNLEERLGAQVFNAVGIFALIFGAAYGLRLAIEHGLIGPEGRVLIGLAVGAGLILWSERFRRKGFAPFSYSLKGVASAILYLSLWAAFHLYGLLPGGAALAAMVFVAAWNAFMAWKQNSELLAIYAIVGGFLTPVLLSTGGDHEMFLFTYLAAIDLGVVLLLRFKPWLRLLTISFPVTVLYFIGYYASYFHESGRGRAAGVGWDGQSSETCLFALLFAALFCLVSLRGWLPASNVDADEPAHNTAATLTSVLLPLANAVFLACALYSIFEDSGLHDALAWVAVAQAALYLGLMRLQGTAVGRAVHLAIAVILLTIAIPLKASGHTLTTAWLVEGIVLFWLSTSFTEREAQAAAILRGLSISGYSLGLCSLWIHWTFFGYAPRSFFNANLASALIAVATLSGAVWIAQSDSVEDRDLGRRAVPQLLLALTAIDLAALTLSLNEILDRASRIPRTAFANIAFADALLGLAILAGATFAAYRLSQEERVGRDRLLACAAVTMVLFNLVAILAIMREIGSLFTATGNDAALRQSLSISAFLMVYGAALLALGFWRRIAFIRWQALILLLFTIAKVFLYDTGGLSQGYRVASFICLGALLMAVSFAYQKDWLSLRAGGDDQNEVAANLSEEPR